MQRKIAFRAWDKKNKEWNYTYVIALHCSGQLYSFPGCLNQTDNYELSQYTNLLDKNGREIYEGDIIQVSEMRYSVYFGYNEFLPSMLGWCVKVLNVSKEAMQTGVFDKSILRGEIIGDIYSNPELLKDNQ